MIARRWQQAEGALVLAAALVIYQAHDGGLGWWGLLAFFAPDISFAGYAFGNRAGSVIYNALHLYGVWAVLLALGLILQVPVVAALGALWLGHAGFDRMLGYGLKSADGFAITHLGRIGRA